MAIAPTPFQFPRTSFFKFSRGFFLFSRIRSFSICDSNINVVVDWKPEKVVSRQHNYFGYNYILYPLLFDHLTRLGLITFSQSLLFEGFLGKKKHRVYFTEVTRQDYEYAHSSHLSKVVTVCVRVCWGEYEK